MTCFGNRPLEPKVWEVEFFPMEEALYQEFNIQRQPGHVCGQALWGWQGAGEISASHASEIFGFGLVLKWGHRFFVHRQINLPIENIK